MDESLKDKVLQKLDEMQDEVSHFSSKMYGINYHEHAFMDTEVAYKVHNTTMSRYSSDLQALLISSTGIENEKSEIQKIRDDLAETINILNNLPTKKQQELNNVVVGRGWNADRNADISRWSIERGYMVQSAEYNFKKIKLEAMWKLIDPTGFKKKEDEDRKRHEEEIDKRNKELIGKLWDKFNTAETENDFEELMEHINNCLFLKRYEDFDNLENVCKYKYDELKAKRQEKAIKKRRRQKILARISTVINIIIAGIFGVVISNLWRESGTIMQGVFIGAFVGVIIGVYYSIFITVYTADSFTVFFKKLDLGDTGRYVILYGLFGAVVFGVIHGNLNSIVNVLTNIRLFNANMILIIGVVNFISGILVYKIACICLNLWLGGKEQFPSI